MKLPKWVHVEMELSVIEFVRMVIVVQYMVGVVYPIFIVMQPSQKDLHLDLFHLLHLVLW